MATTLSLTSTYAGEAAAGYISAALLSGKTIDDGAITVKPNVKYKEVIRKAASDSNIIKDATCDFTDTGTITLTERILQPEEFQVNLEFCKKDFVSSWESIQMGYSAFHNPPPTFVDFVIGHVAGLIAEKTEQNIWGGVNANAGEFDGFTVSMLADGDVNDAANGSQTSFTSSNILTLLENVLADVPSAVYGKEDLMIYMPTIAWKAYITALGGFGASGLGAAGVNAQGTQWYNNGNSLSYLGVKLQHAPGMPADHMVAAQSSNLMFGTGLLNDLNEIRILDMSDLDGSNNFRFIARFTAGVQYGIGSDCTLLTLAS